MGLFYINSEGGVGYKDRKDDLFVASKRPRFWDCLGSYNGGARKWSD